MQSTPPIARLLPRLAVIATGLCLSAGYLSAEPRTCRLVYPQRPKDAPKEAYLFDGTKSHQVALSSMNLSDVIELPPGDISIALTPKEISDPGAITEQMPKLPVAKSITTFYLLILTDPDNQEFPVKWMLVDAGEGPFTPGKTLWHNFTGHRIVAKLGDAGMTIDPNGNAISAHPLPASGYYKASFSYQANGEGPVLPITEQSWWYDANSRHLGFVFDPGARLPKLFMFRDFRHNPTSPEDAP